MRRGRLLSLCLALTFLLTACGESSKLYPASKTDGVFFSVPERWHAISNAALNKYEKVAADNQTSSRQALVKWQVAYSLDPKIKVAQVYSLKPVKSPLILARVRGLTESEINTFSYNSLRDVIIPISQLTQGADLGIPDFRILLDQEIVKKGGRGIQSIYSFSFAGTEQTFNQTVLMSNDRRTLYIFMARCVSTCYKKNKKVMEEIVNSYTVLGAK
jgi:hypothetical protein